MIVKGEAKITTVHNHLGDLTLAHLKKMQGKVFSKKPPRSIIAAKIRSLPETAKPFVCKSLLGRNIRNLRHEANLEPTCFHKIISTGTVLDTFLYSAVSERTEQNSEQGYGRKLIPSFMKYASPHPHTRSLVSCGGFLGVFIFQICYSRSEDGKEKSSIYDSFHGDGTAHINLIK
uniref:Uncharacterized protein n=1 Tax=Ditylenchus dipsaci TaxID=166011 RepID=A0A915ERT5_9BILA